MRRQPPAAGGRQENSDVKATIVIAGALLAAFGAAGWAAAVEEPICRHVSTPNEIRTEEVILVVGYGDTVVEHRGPVVVEDLPSRSDDACTPEWHRPPDDVLVQYLK